jgi:hypothetical protein
MTVKIVYQTVTFRRGDQQVTRHEQKVVQDPQAQPKKLIVVKQGKRTVLSMQKVCDW